MKKTKYLLSFILILFITSCKKSINEIHVQDDPHQEQTKNTRVPQTPEEKLLVVNLQKVTDVLKELYKDKSNLKVVNAAVYSHASSYESVLLRYLIYPSSSILNESKEFNKLAAKWNVNLEQFAKNFWSEANRKNDPDFIVFLRKLDKSSARTQLNGEPEGWVGLYFPYSEEFVPPGGVYEPITTIVTATADADEGIGDHPYYMNGSFQYYVRVTVNDDYAASNPTQIVGVTGLEDYDNRLDPQDPPPPPPPPGVSRVYIGEGICKNQYDKLISFTGNGGGSELKYCHLTGYMQPVNGHITSFQDIASVGFSRADIRYKRFVRNYIIWDDDWVQDDFEQVLGIYEEDNTNTVTFNGTVSSTLSSGSATTPGASVTGSIGYTVVRQSQDAIIRELKMSRNSYFSGAFQDQAWGFRPDYTFIPLPAPHGWPIYEALPGSGAEVGWTWPYSTY